MRFQAPGSEADCCIAQTLGANEPPQESKSLSVSTLDADVLHKSGWRQSFADATTHFNARKGGTAETLRTRMTLQGATRIVAYSKFGVVPGKCDWQQTQLESRERILRVARCQPVAQIGGTGC
jgi:hypothetical protein